MNKKSWEIKVGRLSLRKEWNEFKKKKERKRDRLLLLIK
jgi:hypothetical protein